MRIRKKAAPKWRSPDEKVPGVRVLKYSALGQTPRERKKYQGNRDGPRGGAVLKYVSYLRGGIILSDFAPFFLLVLIHPKQGRFLVNVIALF